MKLKLPSIKPMPVDVKEGDKVIVVRKQPNCECIGSVGKIGTLTKIVEPADHGWPYVLPCMHCAQTSVSHWWGFIGEDVVVRIDQLEKIRPPSSSESIKHDEQEYATIPAAGEE